MDINRKTIVKCDLHELTRVKGSIVYNSQITYDRIKERAKSTNMSIKRLNSLCSLSENAISSAAKSQEGMKAKNLYAISECLDCTVDYLLGKTEDPHSYRQANSLIGNISNVSNNSGIVGSVGSTINNEPTALDDHQKLLLELYSKLSPADQIRLINQLIDDDSKKNTQKGQ